MHDVGHLCVAYQYMKGSITVNVDNSAEGTDR